MPVDEWLEARHEVALEFLGRAHMEWASADDNRAVVIERNFRQTGFLDTGSRYFVVTQATVAKNCGVLAIRDVVLRTQL